MAQETLQADAVLLSSAPTLHELPRTPAAVACFATHLCRDNAIDHGTGHHARADESELRVVGRHSVDLMKTRETHKETL